MREIPTFCAHGREHEVTPRDRDVRGDARALRADRLLGDLHHDLLALAHQRLDRRRTPVASAALPIAAVALVELLDVFDVVAGVQESGLLEADVHERRLHAGQHPHDPAFDHAPDHALAARSLEVELDELLLLENCDTGLARGRIDQDFVLHPRLWGRKTRATNPVISFTMRLQRCGPSSVLSARPPANRAGRDQAEAAIPNTGSHGRTNSRKSVPSCWPMPVRFDRLGISGFRFFTALGDFGAPRVPASRPALHFAPGPPPVFSGTLRHSAVSRAPP